MLKEEIMLLSTYLLRMFSQKNSLLKKVESGRIVGGVEAVSKLASDITKRHLKLNEDRLQKFDVTSSNVQIKPPLSETQKLLILEQELRHCQKHVKKVELEMLNLQDRSQGKTEEVQEFLEFITEQDSDFRRKLLDTSGSVSKESLMLWMRNIVTKLDNKIQAAKMARKKETDQSTETEIKLKNPIENMTMVDFLALEVQCKQAADGIIDATDHLKNMERTWSKISRQRTLLQANLTKIQKGLLSMENKIQQSDVDCDEMKEQRIVFDQESRHLAQQNSDLLTGMTKMIYPSEQSYMIIEQETLALQNELKFWKAKVKILKNLERTRPSSIQLPSSLINPSLKKRSAKERTLGFMPVHHRSASIFAKDRKSLLIQEQFEQQLELL
ncbi:uncharacterized protein LOC129586798 isoform X2 [Paramacrobiotus metropolitanus]|nr:uncharacterized protein LOC129586798 isoform X2 [Paramacrobiotus metropolitanus]XP_055336200.1 uncharacterized protein LOC129586798 isoform X2 [Paramacrobiotus metropolitanus]XP_055336201.1 uncharacterized protein LOC129586798 isoform X2 [Paramacrobiotus metropolitanus]XP_055336202.1 uncharacterized protein LOC129586798 isoform X2 [Paramacrobiotus metropolitanus]